MPAMWANERLTAGLLGNKEEADGTDDDDDDDDDDDEEEVVWFGFSLTFCAADDDVTEEDGW